LHACRQATVGQQWCTKGASQLTLNLKVGQGQVEDVVLLDVLAEREAACGRQLGLGGLQTRRAKALHLQSLLLGLGRYRLRRRVGIPARAQQEEMFLPVTSLFNRYPTSMATAENSCCGHCHITCLPMDEGFINSTLNTSGLAQQHCISLSFGLEVTSARVLHQQMCPLQ
jgi:hypothetical protein